MPKSSKKPEKLSREKQAYIISLSPYSQQKAANRFVIETHIGLILNCDADDPER